MSNSNVKCFFLPFILFSFSSDGGDSTKNEDRENEIIILKSRQFNRISFEFIYWWASTILRHFSLFIETYRIFMPEYSHHFSLNFSKEKINQKRKCALSVKSIEFSIRCDFDKKVNINCCFCPFLLNFGMNINGN